MDEHNQLVSCRRFSFPLIGKIMIDDSLSHLRPARITGA